MSERVKPDVHRWVDDSALYDRSTILRVIDDEIAKWTPVTVDTHTNGAIAALDKLRARFEEADDA